MLFWRKQSPAKTADKPLYGVNLGGWLVLEKWMTPSLFAGTDAVDEYTFSSNADASLQERLKEHRDSFVTQSDFLWLQLHGIRAVRLPIGYWVFGDEEPYLATIEYVDKAFQWAEETGIKILLDMHAAPGSQNGNDHSGRSGSIGWDKDSANIIKTLDVITKLARRYKASPSLLGIELLNEPSPRIPRRNLLKFYQAGYRIIRGECGPDTWVVFHDAFRPKRWKRKLKQTEYSGMYIDRHEYQNFSKHDKRLNVSGHLDKTLGTVKKLLGKMARWHPVVVGEWSLALDQQSVSGLNETEQLAARIAYGAAQLLAYENSTGWFYWSYKTEEGGVWSFRDCIEKGWLPNFSTYT
jgi:glucan 1,3-beta-glucosidase